VPDENPRQEQTEDDDSGALVRVARLRDLEGCGRQVVRVGEEEILLLKLGSTVVAVGNRCPHQGVRLDSGQVEGTTIHCSGHGWKFDVCDAGLVRHWWQRSINYGRRARLKVFRVVLDDQDILIQLVHPRQSMSAGARSAGATPQYTPAS
jgi:nitrite reductase/ring-hydroxylating ferredoxin subunit